MPRLLGLCFAATVLLAAFLLFQVQPLVSKSLLPAFGGTPAVWTTCMLFFQVVLFVGYAYAHASCRFLRPSTQGVVHLTLIFLALMLLPITPDASVDRGGVDAPALRLLMLLAVSVGVPYFLLSSTGPLLQAWFSRQPQLCETSRVYRMYALSNFGSLAALLSYPFVVEPALTTRSQGAWWSVGFALFALLCGCCALAARRHATPPPTPIGDSPRLRLRVDWLLLPALASAMLLAITNHICQDVAAIPFLWVAPLSLYLVSFILCFESSAWYRRRVFGPVLAISCVAVGWTMLFDRPASLGVEVGLNFAALFCAAMVCHGELAARKPGPQQLTSFYLMAAAGGALGGASIAVAAPLLFSGYAEFKLGLIVCYLLGLVVTYSAYKSLSSTPPTPLTPPTPQRAASRLRLRGALVLALSLAGLLILLRARESIAVGQVRHSVRNFYGVLSVDEFDAADPARHGFVLRHGRVLHGLQYVSHERRRLPTTYYHERTGVGLLLRALNDRPALRVGVVGLGVGTLAAYGRPGDTYRFYEINPAVAELAREYFTFLQDCPARCEIVLGDARVSLEREPPQHYDVLVLDAFSGDAIPSHLLSVEAFEVYRRHLASNGVLALHITNRHVDLNPVVRALARHHKLSTLRIKCDRDDHLGASAACWILAASDPASLSHATLRAAADAPDAPNASHILWRDDFSNLLEVLR